MIEHNNKKINIIHTPCKNCVFAVYNDVTQVDCAADRLNHFKDIGYEILEAYDNDKEFFVINNKKCIFIRTDEWLHKKNISSIDMAVQVAYEENNIKYILLLDIDGDTTQSDIETTINQLCVQNIPPVGILVMVDKKDRLKINIQSLAKYLDKQKIKWRIQKFIDDSMDATQKIKAIIQSAPVNRYYFYIKPQNFQTNIFDVMNINTKILDGFIFGCMSIAGGLLFSYLSWQYAKNNKNIDILSDSQYQIKYEDIK